MSNKKRKNKKNTTQTTNNQKMATPEQMETLNSFVKTYSADLSKQLRQLDLITRISK